MTKLTNLTLRGFKSIKEATIEFGAMNVLIGANGAGKSNLISFFRMISEMMEGRFQVYVGINGRGHAFVHHGSGAQYGFDSSLFVESEDLTAKYSAKWANTSGDTLLFDHEAISYKYKNAPDEKREIPLPSGRFESGLTLPFLDPFLKSFDPLLRFLDQIEVYHFHDTTVTSRMKQIGFVPSHTPLLHDGGNVAAFLYNLSIANPACYKRIVSTVRLIAPFFRDFYLEPQMPSCSEVSLNWRHVDSDLVFGPHQLSDGTLRAICLIALLLQPEEKLPSLIVVDEPELGLHPYALNVIAALFQKAASHSQVLISTQSSAFLDQFQPEDVIVVDRTEKGSSFTRPDAKKLKAWLEEYSLGEIWDKNIIAGGPH